MEKIGYKVNKSYDYHVRLLELTIVGDAHRDVPDSYVVTGIYRGVKWPCIALNASGYRKEAQDILPPPPWL